MHTSMPYTLKSDSQVPLLTGISSPVSLVTENPPGLFSADVDASALPGGQLARLCIGEAPQLMMLYQNL